MNPNLGTAIKNAFGVKSEQEKQEDTTLNRSNLIFDGLYKSRRKAEYDWWLNDQFYNGEQYTLFNKGTQSVERSTTYRDKITVNLIKKNGRYVVMWLNRDHPQAKIKPGSSNDENYVRVKIMAHALDYWYQTNQMNKKYKQVTLDAYKYKIGIAKTFWDGTAIAPTTPYKGNDGKPTTKSLGEVTTERVDPFEIYWDPMASDVESCRFICHAIPRTLGEIKANKNYKNTDKVSADGKLSASYLKAGEIRSKTNGAINQNIGGGDFDTVIVREMYWREVIGNEWKIRKVVTTDNGVLLEDKIWPHNFYPFEFYLADVQGMPMDGNSPVKDLRSAQRAYNSTLSRISENVRLMSGINWRMPRNANVNVITDEAGQFLEYDVTPGGHPEQVTPAAMPSYVEAYATRLRNDLDDLGGNHSASYGKSPGSKASGELVNRLQEGDSNNLLLMRDNFDDFQARVARKQLLTFKDMAKVDRQIPSQDTNSLGLYDFEALTPSMIEIEDQIVVTSGSNMPYSQMDRQEFLLNMKKENIISNDQFIKALGSPDLDAATKNDDADIERALQENRDLLAGKPVPNPARQEDHTTHLRIHTQLVKSKDWVKASDKIKNMIESHIGEHINTSYILAQISNSLNVEPIKRSETINYRPSNLLEMTPTERTQMFSKFGVQSDVAEIVARGGLNVQDPAAAEQQAQAEDNDMLDGKPRAVGVGDNHQVHIETHTQLMQTEAWAHVPDVVKTLVTQHVHDHIVALQSMAPSPGLQPRTNGDIPATTQIFQKNPNQGGAQQPVAKAAMNPQDPTPRPVMSHEMLQNSGAVKNNMASERMMQKQADDKAKEQAKAQSPLATKKKPKSSKKT